MAKIHPTPLIVLLFSPLLILFIGADDGIKNTQVNPVPSTINDFFLPGSQPGESGTFKAVGTCNCHEWVSEEPLEVPMFNWQGSMMAQAARDPIYLACLAVSNQDAPEVGDLCIRCHAPVGWLGGRSQPTDGSALTNDDRQGVQCHFCHKLVKPTTVGNNPYPGDQDYLTSPGANKLSTYDQDQTYLASMTSIPETSGNGMYICEDDDKNRRGPFFDSDAKHDNPYSPFHPEANLCGTCHDVSNPAFSTVRDVEGNILGYAPNDFDTPAPDFDPYELFPVERTFSEWKMSDYNTPAGVYSEYFGGNKDYVSTCQDCHMKDITGQGASNTKITRTNLPHHDLTGGNTFMPDLVANLFPGEVNVDALNAGKERARYMLQHAATVNVEVTGQQVDVEVINETGHKLPSGYPEGRRIWLHVKAYDLETADVYESGRYNYETATLEKEGAKIYEIKPGISEDLAPALGLEAGPSFHFVLNHQIFKDNRIPPRGFDNAAFEAIQSPPVAYTYADGQYWDNTVYDLPFEPEFVEVTLNYQTTSKEYVEFLKDENVTNDAGQTMYDQWSQFGKSAPEEMNFVTWSSDAGITLMEWTGDVNSDWTEPGNFSPNGTPDASNNVIVPSGLTNYPVVDAPGACNFLILESGTRLTVPSGNALIVNGALVLKDGREGVPSVLEYGDLTVNGFIDAQVQMDDNRWHYFAPPLAGQVAGSFIGLYLYSYDTETDSWINIVDETTPLQAGMGYKAYTFGTDHNVGLATYRGDGADMISGDYSLPVSYFASNPFNFVGNPYLSAIDWDNASWVKTGIAASVYIWDGVQYISWNGSTGDLTDGIIPAMQAFFVATDGSTTTPELTVSNLARVHGTDLYKKSGDPGMRIRAEGNGYYDNTFICFDTDATPGFDSRHDAYKFMGLEEAPQLYTMAGTEKTRINVLPLSLADRSVGVDLVASVEGEYILSFTGQHSFTHYDMITLEDRLLQKTTDLSEVQEYKVSAGPDDDPDRFVVHFKNSLHEGLGANDLRIYSYGNKIILEDLDGEDLPEHVEIYDLEGKCIFSTDLGESNVNILDPDAKAGLYLVKAYTGSTIITKKVLLK